MAAAMSPGDVVLARDPLRPNPAIFVNRSVDTRLEDCVIHSSPGIGLLAQRSENVAFCGSGNAGVRRSGSFAKSVSTNRRGFADAAAASTAKNAEKTNAMCFIFHLPYFILNQSKAACPPGFSVEYM